MKVAGLSRVAHPLHGVGGLERHVGALVRHLVRRGIEITLYTTLPEREDVEAPTGVRVELVPYRLIPWPRRSGFIVADRNTNYPAWSLRVGRRVRSQPVDIVQAEAGAGFGYAWFRPPGGAPLVLHPHGMEEFKAGWLKRSAYLPLRWAIRYAARRAEKVLIPDRVMAGEVREHLSVGEGKTVVLPNAIDLEEIDRSVPAAARDAILSRLGIDEKRTLILSVGRLESNKGFSFLAEALARCKDELPRTWLWILVGAGPEESRLIRAVRDRGLVEATRFAGRVSDTELAALYSEADLFAHPTLYEGSSLVTLEAMAHSLPVVATAVGGIPDKVTEGESGFLVPAGDAGALASALVKAFRLGGNLAELGRSGRRRVESEFSWTERARKLIDLYSEVLAADRSP